MSAPSSGESRPIRQPFFRGSVLAAGLFADVRVTGEAIARERLLGAMDAGARAFRSGGLLVVCLRVPARMSTHASPAGLLVRHGEVLSSAPLQKDELASLGFGAEGAARRPGAPLSAFDVRGSSAVIVVGGEPVVIPLDDAHGEDPVSWIDVSDFEVADGTEPLGRAEKAPRSAVAARDVDVRGALGVAAAPPEARAAERALAGRGEESQGVPGGAPGRWAALGRLAARFFAGLSAWIQRLVPGPAGAGGGREQGRTTNALEVIRDERPAGRSWLSAVARGLHVMALRMLVWSRLAHVVGRRQAEYLSSMLDMFDRGDLDAALRHAISLGGDAGGEPAPPALATPSPRKDLAISPARHAGGPALYSGPNLYEELRRRYRRAFEQLARSGEVEKAAFVLAELLGADEEAVAFLEKHGRFRLAAEIAEARRLPAGLCVRQWFLAGDVRRAVLLARSRGAFADAVHRLEASGHARQAQALRLAWADSLAEGGNYAAAVTAAWPVEQARGLAGRWLDLAIEVGGITGAKMALLKARLFPESFGEVRDRVLGLLREPGEEGSPVVLALAAEIGSCRDDPSSRVLAKPVLRALMKTPVPEGEEQSHRALVDGLLDASGDALLSAEVRMLWKKQPPSTVPAVSFTAAGATEVGRMRTVNEDAPLLCHLSQPPAGATSLRGDVSKQGIVLGVFDGMGGMSGGDAVSRLAVATVADRLRRAFGSAVLQRATGRREDVSFWARALRDAVTAANEAIFRRSETVAYFRGCGSTAAVATVAGGTLIVAHVGNSRAYLLRAGRLTALTRDHTLLREYREMAEKSLSPEEIEALPRNVITRALGMKEGVEVDVATLPLRDGDTLLLCSDGVTEALSDEQIRAALSGGGDAGELCAALCAACDAAEPADDRTVVIARFEGEAPGAPEDAPVVPQPFTPEADGEAAPLHDREKLLLVYRAAADAGALPVHDAAELPDGRLLAALGELGAWLISRDGRPIARFAEPAHSIVMSDHGDRALLLAGRGETVRIARLDLARRRQQPWCDARFGAHACDFDGSIWHVASGDTLYAIDAAQAGWEHLWQVSEPGATFLAVARDETSLSALLAFGGGRNEVWTFELPSHRLRSRVHVESAGRMAAASLSPEGDLVAFKRESREGTRFFLHKGHDDILIASEPAKRIREALLTSRWLAAAGSEGDASGVDLFDTATTELRLRVGLLGSERTGCRVRGDHLLVFDDRGRLLVISLRTGAVIRETYLT